MYSIEQALIKIFFKRLCIQHCGKQGRLGMQALVPS